MRKPPPTPISRQQGAHSAFAAFFLLVAAGGLVAMALTFFAAFALFSGRARRIALGVVAAGWAIFLYATLIGPARESTSESNWRVAAYDLCSKELKALPSRLEVEGLYDEGALFRNASIAALFKWRGLHYIEVKVRRGKDGRSFIALGDGYTAPWTVDAAAGRIARIELGERSRDPVSCPPTPSDLRYTEGLPPFLHDTCFKVTFADTPTARHHLVLAPADAAGRTRYGRWQLVDRATNNTLAALTTVDVPELGSAGHLREDIHPRNDDCRSPHGVIADRIYSPTKAPGHADLVLAEATVAPNPSIRDVAGRVQSFPVVPSTGAQYIFPSQQEERRLLHADSMGEGWPVAILAAKSSGHAGHGRRLVAWEQRKLVTLNLRWNQTETAWPWEAIAVRDGFFVVDMNQWKHGIPNLLARYSSSGEFLWAVGVTLPADFPPAPCRTFRPRGMEVVGKELRMYDSCTTLESAVLAVPLKSLPWAPSPRARATAGVPGKSR